MDIILSIGGLTSQEVSSMGLGGSLQQLVTGDPWQDGQGTFRVNTLESILDRCACRDQVEHGVQFLGMLNYINLATKMKRLVTQLIICGDFIFTFVISICKGECCMRGLLGEGDMHVRSDHAGKGAPRTKRT
ncbi:hypothetical protein BDZ94DRAFT_355658 [Collybia nuda]|uniref:Uncharacterized protein n=1 Tax=Collybia nuda TaxID=64659 RepID=A0A9P5XVG3_9AGAR|nr:hypothetical protein BDZ94DRAFT_355658 [Collybia nuda]